ncbi:uncharacterized protein LOC132624112 [Lycium barbarum]|uniref:uncharacterized protein LOC132624112 n=1 Tax=Lycium barbarum TaxID=112863 RepID=UPI00293E4F7E|nr:uncharacterized protein LOC132624112 [Lycium barbarum]
MGTDSIYRRSPFYGCMSPSCIPVHEEYSRINECRRGGRGSYGKTWRKMLKKLVNEGKNVYGKKTLMFHYDAVSYSQNFDEGCNKDDYPIRHHQVFRDFRITNVRFCYCGLVADLKMSKTPINLGRRFWGCQRYASGNEYGYFRWVDPADPICQEQYNILINSTSVGREGMEGRLAALLPQLWLLFFGSLSFVCKISFLVQLFRLVIFSWRELQAVRPPNTICRDLVIY